MTASKRVLLVEDELEAQGALARALSRAGYEVLAASDVAGAASHLDAARPPDVAIIDVVLGEVDNGGLVVLEALRAITRRAPAIVITAFADVSKVKAALNLGATHLLEKPFRAAELLDVMGRVLAGRDERSEMVERAFLRANLTPREGEIATLALKGLSSPEIANVLGMSDKTVRQHLSRVYEKLEVRGRGELVHLLFPI